MGGMLPTQPGGPSPFASNRPISASSVEPAAANSNRVLAIVVALLFSIGVGFVIVAFVLLFGFLTFRPDQSTQGMAGVDPERHHRDTGVVEAPDEAPVRTGGGRRSGGGAVASGDDASELFGGIGGGPVTIHVQGPGADEYHGIEITCGIPGNRTFRERARFRNGRAHIALVPAKKCRLNFQGHVPLKAWVVGGDTKTCVFKPSLNCNR